MPDSPWQHDEMAAISLAGMDRKFLPGTEQEVEFLTKALGIPAGGRVLDLGCGAGRHSIALARRGYEVTGVDISPLLLKEAARRAAEAGVGISLCQGNLAELGPGLVGRKPFDAALCLCESGLGALGGDQADLAFLRAVCCLLRPGGGLALTTFNAIRRYRQGGAFDHVSGTVHWQAPIAGGLEEDIRQYVPAELALLLRVAGFTDVLACGCAPGDFRGQPLEPDDIEMMLIARRPES